MLPLHDKNKVMALLKEGAQIITPNNRLSSVLLEEYYIDSNQDTVVKPFCFPYAQAIERLMQQHKEPPNVLTDWQCRYLWSSILKDTPSITFSEGLLHAVMEAWQTCEQWQVNPDNNAFSLTPQTKIFQQWWQQFRHKTEQLHAITRYQIIPFLTEAPEACVDKSIVWFCFDEFSPQQKHFQAYMTNQGITQYTYDLDYKQTTPLILAAEQEQEEFEQLICWLHKKVQQGQERIAVVVPELQKKYRQIHRALASSFNKSQFNVSLGEPLSTNPLIAHALCCLSLEQTCSPQELETLILSPYIGASEEEFVTRAQYIQDGPFGQQQIIDLLRPNQDLERYAPKFAAILKRIPPLPQNASPQQWAELFKKRLNQFGFPGELGLNSAQYQYYQRLTGIFDEFSQLTMVATDLSKKEALAELTQLATNTIFQIQKNKTPIQILGLLEASGSTFDSLWIMGLNDQCLPAKPRLSAFIPLSIQHELQMPHHSAARELRFAKQTLERLLKATPEAVLSYSKLQADSPNLACSLITHYPHYTKIAATQRPLTSAVTTCTEEYTVPLTSNERITGGTSLLGNQAKCPFKAFAEHRLAARALPRTDEVTDYKLRGTMMHKIMELLWKKLKSQTALQALPNDSLEDLVNSIIQTAQLESDTQEQIPIVQEIEHTRLKRLVLDCLRWEKQRPPFTIQELERSYTLSIAGLDITVRVDRLDKVDHKIWVIDYKSALPNNKPWNEERPQEPQLLLYALLNDEINTLLFLQVKAGSILCSGISETKTDIKGISTLKTETPWTKTKTLWQDQLTALGTEIQAGYCAPTPSNTTVCTRCDFKNLCRIA